MSSVTPGPFLIIQTAFTGDVILATALAEKLHRQFPEASIDFLVRKGNESLFDGHPFVRHVLIWQKKKNKARHLLQLILQVRRIKYDRVINVQRFFSSGLITVFSNARYTVGFNKNPLSFLFSKKVTHQIVAGKHEVDRNQNLIADITDGEASRPKLYPASKDFATVLPWQQHLQQSRSYICIAPASIWFTKQYPREKWVEFIQQLQPDAFRVLLLGAQSDHDICEFILKETAGCEVVNLAGKLSYLESAALMNGAVMNFVNDSAPLHLASAMNAPVTAIYCSTIPDFGFGPLSDNKRIVEIEEKLYCRPCGLHGFKACPEGHFKCALMINLKFTAS